MTGLQKTVAPGNTGTRPANALGYYREDKHDMVIFSRYPIVEDLNVDDDKGTASPRITAISAQFNSYAPNAGKVFIFLAKYI